jgi:hypothetical protein
MRPQHNAGAADRLLRVFPTAAAGTLPFERVSGLHVFAQVAEDGAGERGGVEHDQSVFAALVLPIEGCADFHVVVQNEVARSLVANPTPSSGS